MGLQWNHNYIYKREAEGGLIIDRRRQCDHRGRDWSDVATSHRRQATMGARRGQEWHLSEGVQSCWHRDFGSVRILSFFWPPEPGETNFLLFKATKSALIESNHRKQIHSMKFSSNVLGCAQYNAQHITSTFQYTLTFINAKARTNDFWNVLVMHSISCGCCDCLQVWGERRKTYWEIVCVVITYQRFLSSGHVLGCSVCLQVTSGWGMIVTY